MGVDILNNRQVTLKGCVPSETILSSNRSSVKRSLFGPVDHKEAMAFFEKEFSKMEKEKMCQWNFDFHNEKPIKGPLKWEKVKSSPKPTSYNKVTKKSPRKICPLRKRSLVNHDSINNRRQTTITDYINVTKKNICNKNNQSQIP